MHNRGVCLLLTVPLHREKQMGRVDSLFESFGLFENKSAIISQMRENESL